MTSAAFLIYSGVMPLLKTFIPIFFGYSVARKGLFPPAASRGASQVTMSIALPCLIFYNIVNAFTPSNVSAIGPLFLLACIYLILGFAFGLIIREIFYVPRNFWQGILILCGMSNWGNLPNAIVATVMKQAPFDPDTDPALGISFVSIFIVAYHITFWVLGAAYSISWDYLPGVPQGRDAERHFEWDEKPIGSLIARYILRRAVREHASTTVPALQCGPDEKSVSETPKKLTHVLESSSWKGKGKAPLDEEIEVGGISMLVRQPSHLSGAPSFRSRRLSATTGRPEFPIGLCTIDPSCPPSTSNPETANSGPKSSISAPVSPPAVLARVLKTLDVIATPVTMTMAVALPTALIQPLKSLLVDTSNVSSRYNWKGPDGRPPLAFVMDTANLVGGIAVPLALIILGTSFSRLTIPRPLSRLPIAAMLSVSFAKMVLLPIIGIFIVRAMVKGGFIPEDAKAERFVGMFLSGTPAAVNQLIVAQLYSPDGDLNTLSAFLLVQYVLMFFASSGLTAISLLLL